MKQAENTHTLPDGRIIAYNQYGDFDGFPIFAFHGLPGSRIWFSENDETAKSLGIRLLTVDRPGFGNSTPQNNRTILNFSDDINELADELKLDKYSVFGISGGGAFAAALSHQFPNSIHKCGMVASVSPFENGKPPKEMAAENKAVFTLSRRFPWLLKFLLNQQKKLIEKQPSSYIQSVMTNTKHLCEADRSIMENEENAEFLITHLGEAFKNGVKGTVVEAKLFTKDWGFNLKDISVPVEVWHGTEDTLSPIGPIRKISSQLPNAQMHFIEGKGHFLTEYPDLWKDILLSLKN